MYSVGETSGGLEWVETQTDGFGGISGMSGVNASLASADGNDLYLAAAGSSSVIHFRRDPFSGTLTYGETITNGSEGGLDAMVMPSALAMSSDSTSLYVASNYDPGAVVAFHRDPVSGQLTFVQQTVEGFGGVLGLNGADGVIVTPGGEQVYLTGREQNTLAEFDRNAGDARVFCEQNFRMRSA